MISGYSRVLQVHRSSMYDLIYYSYPGKGTLPSPAPPRPLFKVSRNRETEGLAIYV